MDILGTQSKTSSGTRIGDDKSFLQVNESCSNVLKGSHVHCISFMDHWTLKHGIPGYVLTDNEAQSISSHFGNEKPSDNGLSSPDELGS